MSQSPMTDKPPGIYFFAPEERSAIDAWANHENLQLLNVNLNGLADAQSVLRKTGKDLSFPSWYGSNFDALFDCLSDPDNLHDQSCLLKITGINSFRVAAPEAFSTLIEVFDGVVDTLSDGGLGMWIIIDVPAPGISRLFPV